MLGWEPITSAEAEAYGALQEEEAVALPESAVRAADADWQCDGHTGAGPCGYVLRAVDSSGRFLALKRVRVPPAGRRDLERRLQTLLGVRHPHLIEYAAVEWRPDPAGRGGG